jgi:hypothetical protein
MSKVFIIGPTGSGKSYLAQRLSEKTGVQIVEGGHWIRSLTNRWDHGPEAAEFLARESKQALAKDPEAALKAMRAAIDGKPAIVVGLRNVLDFKGLFEPGDILVRMTGNPATEFESTGIAQIAALAPVKHTLTLGEYGNPEIKEIADHLRPKSNYVMTDWGFPLRVRQTAFKNDTGAATLQDAKVFGFGVAAGRPVEIIVGQDEFRFYDVPLRFTGEHGGLQYALVNSDEVPTYVPEPRPRSVVAQRLPWAPAEPGTCYGSITWDAGNVTYMVVVLNSGELLLWPPHKVVWSDTPKTFPVWLKRRYADDEPTLPLTRVWEASEQDMDELYPVACAAIKDSAGWRSHGIGLIQKYMPGPLGPDQYRVHVWTPEAVRIGLESGIHNHRYDLTSTIIHGVLTQEEWTASPNPDGMWQEWGHVCDRKMRGESMPASPSGRYFDLVPRTLDIRCGQSYSFPRHGYHRSVPRSAVVVTVMQRSNIGGNSWAMAYRGFTPVNGQTVSLPIEEYLQRARKELMI